MQESNAPVLIAGGGPCGLMLANELGRRGIGALLVDEKPSTAFNPQANATQARTMEHFRRLGFADEVRSLGLPPEFPTDIAYFTRFARHELARFALPSSRDARTKVAGLTGSWSAAELPHRVSQKFVEAVLRRHAEKLPASQCSMAGASSISRRPGTPSAARSSASRTGIAARALPLSLRRGWAPKLRARAAGLRLCRRDRSHPGFHGRPDVRALCALPGFLQARPACAGLDERHVQSRAARVHGCRRRSRGVRVSHTASPSRGGREH